MLDHLSKQQSCLFMQSGPAIEPCPQYVDWSSIPKCGMCCFLNPKKLIRHCASFFVVRFTRSSNLVFCLFDFLIIWMGYPSMPMILWLLGSQNSTMCSCVLSPFRLFVTLKTVAYQAPLSMGFPRQEYWSGLPFPPPGDLPDPGMEPTLFISPTLADRFFSTSTTWEALYWYDRPPNPHMVYFLFSGGHVS